MINLLAAELLKLKTVRATWGYLLAAIAFSGLIAAGNIGGESQSERVDAGFQERIVLDGCFAAVVLALLLSMLAVTNEFRHGTIARSLLVTPRRFVFVALKVATGALVGIGLALLALVTTIVMAAIWLGLLDVSLSFGDLAGGAWRGALAALLVGALGAGIGGAVHAQVAALVGTLIWIFVAEPIVWVLLGLLDWDGVSEYLPAATVLGITDLREGPSFPASIGMAALYAAVAAALAWLRTSRRDIT